MTFSKAFFPNFKLLNGRFVLVLTMLFSSPLFSQYTTGKYFQEGRLELNQKNFIKAIEKFSAAIAFEPRMYDAYFYRAAAKLELQDFGGAEDDLSVAIYLYPYDVRYFLYRGLARSQTFNFRGALWDFEKALDIDSNVAEVYINRAIVNLSLRNFEAVLADCKKAEALKIKGKDLFLIRGTAFKEMERYQESIEDFNRIIKLDTNLVDAWINRGLSYLALENMDSSFADFTKVLDLDSTNPIGYFYLGNWYLQNDQSEEAINFFNTSIQLSSKNSAVYFNRAIAKARLKKREEAILDFDKVLSLSPKNITALYNRAGVKFANGDLQGAYKDYSKAIHLYPKYADAYYNRSLVNANLGNRQEAELDKKKAGYLQQTGQSFSKDASVYETGKLLKLTDFKNEFYSRKSQNTHPEYRVVDIEFFPIFILHLEGLEAQKYFAFEFSESSKKSELKLILQNDSLDSPISSREIGKLDSLIKVDPKNYNHYLQKGIWQVHTSSFHDAIENFNQALLLSPNNFKVLFARANARLQLARQLYTLLPQEGLLNYDDGLKVEKENLDKLHKLILADYELILEQQPSFSFVWHNISYAQALHGNYTEALKAVTACVKIDRNMAESFFNRGLLRILFLDEESGCRDLSTAGELGISKSYSLIQEKCR